MAYTEFGEFFRVLRIKKHEVLADASAFLGVSCAFISAVECGKKRIPDNWAELIANHYKLNNDEKQSLIDSIDKSRNIVNINIESSTPQKKMLALQFQRSFHDIDEKSLNEIKEILNRINNK